MIFKKFKGVSAKTEKLDWPLILSAITLALMVYARDMSILHLGPIYFVGVIAVFSVLLPYKSFVPFVFFYMGAGVGVNGIAMIPLLGALIIKSGSVNMRQIIFPVILLLLELLSWQTYSFPTEPNRFVVYSLFVVLFFYLLFDEKNDNEEIRKNIQFYILGVSVAVLIIMIHSASSLGFEDIAFGTYRIGGDTGELSAEGFDGDQYTAMNPNTLAYYSITAIALTLYVKNAFRSIILKTTVLIILGIAGVMSTSRTWLVVIALTLATYFLFSKMKGKVGFVVFSVILLIAAAQVANYVDAFTSRFETRFEQGTLGEAGGRVDIIKLYNNFLFSNPEYLVFGTGAVYYTDVCGVGLSSHSGAHQVLICYGFFGVLIYIVAGVIYYRRFCRKKHSKLWFYMPFIVCFVFDQTVQFLTPAPMMLPFVACLLPLKLKQYQV